jgi:hypothetical protein
MRRSWQWTTESRIVGKKLFMHVHGRSVSRTAMLYPSVENRRYFLCDNPIRVTSRTSWYTGTPFISIEPMKDRWTNAQLLGRRQIRGAVKYEKCSFCFLAIGQFASLW